MFKICLKHNETSSVVVHRNQSIKSIDSVAGGIPIMIGGLLELRVSKETGRPIGLEGHEDKIYWKNANLKMPTILPGEIVWEGSLDLAQGVGIDARAKALISSETYYSENNKVLLIGEPCQQVYRLLKNVYVALIDEKISSIYLFDI
jgi:hypothetical protein